MINISKIIKKDRHGLVKDLTGQRFGRLIVLEYVGVYSNRGDSVWKCRCDCGNIKITTRSNLLRKTTKSCGCLQRDSKCGRKYSKIDLSKIKYVTDKNVAYFIGFVAADGNIEVSKKKSERVRVQIHKQDTHILERFREILGLENPIILLPKKNQAVLSICQQGILDVFSSHKITPNKTHTLKFTKNISEGLLKYFILGYFDGDGCVSIKNSKDKYSICIVGASKSFLKSVRSFFRRNSIESFLQEPTKGLYKLEVSKKRKNVENLYNLFYSDSEVYLKRKKRKFEQAVFLAPKQTQLQYNRKRRKAVYVTNLQDGKKTKYKSISEAVKILGLHSRSVSYVLSGQRKHTKGYFIEYVNRKHL